MRVIASLRSKSHELLESRSQEGLSLLGNSGVQDSKEVNVGEKYEVLKTTNAAGEEEVSFCLASWGEIKSPCLDIPRCRVGVALKNRVSFMIIMLVIFLGDAARGIFFPTLWTNITSMGGNRVSLGYCVGAFSFGRMVASPFFGKLSSKGYRSVLIQATCLIVAGAMCYATARRIEVLMAAQVLLGIGSGTLGVTRAYVADKTTLDQRTRFLAYTTAVQYAGFTCTPFMGGSLSFLLGDSEIALVHDDVLVLNQFTAPAMLIATGASVLLGLLYFLFKDGIANPHVKSSTPKADIVACSDWTDSSAAAQGLLGENVDTPLTGAETRPSKVDKTRSGSEGVLKYCAQGEEQGDVADAAAWSRASEEVLMKAAPRYADAPSFAVTQRQSDAKPDGLSNRRYRRPHQLLSTDTVLIPTGFLLNITTKGTISVFETLGAQYARAHLGMTNARIGYVFAAFGALGVLSLGLMHMLSKRFNDVQLVLGGLAVMILSCVTFVPSPRGAHDLPFFMCAVFLMYSFGYPIGHTAVLGLFSKVVGERPQGVLLGIFGSAGSLARITFPVIAGVTAHNLGTSKLFMAMVAVLSATFAILYGLRVPYLRRIQTAAHRASSRELGG